MTYPFHPSSSLSAAPVHRCRPMPRVRTWLSMLALFGLSSIVQAAGLEEVYQSAKANDPVLGAAAAQLDASREIGPQARSQLLPSIGMQGTSSWNERDFLQTGVEQDFNDHGWGAQLSQPLFNLERWYTYSSARAAVDAAEHNYAGTEQQVIVRTVQAYLDVLRADARLESTRAAEAAVQRQLEQVQQRFDVGLVAITDVLEAQASYDNVVVARVQAAGDHDIFFEVLRTLTVQPYTEILRLSESLPIVDPAPSNEEEWVSSALATNFQIKAAESQLTSAERTVRARRAAHLPTIDGTVSFNHYVTDGANFLAGKIDTTIYGVTARLPIYQGGFTSSRVSEAQALAERSRELLQDSRLTVSRDTRNLFRRVQTDVVRVRARLKAIASAESALEATTTGYEVGTRNIVDVLRAQEALYASQFDYADSRYNYVLSLVLLKQRAGVLNEEDVAELATYMDPNEQVKQLLSLRDRGVN